MNNEMAIHAGKEESFPVFMLPGRETKKSDFVKKVYVFSPQMHGLRINRMLS